MRKGEIGRVIEREVERKRETEREGKMMVRKEEHR